MATKLPIVLTNGELEQIQYGDVLAGVIPATSLTTIYLSPTGSDTNGDGTSGNPYFSINKAMEVLAPYAIPPNGSVTIELAAGTYNYTEKQNINHPDGDKITIKGSSANYAFSHIVSITGSAGNWSVKIQITPNLAGDEAVGQYCYLYSLTSPVAELDLTNDNAGLTFRPPEANNTYNNYTFVANDAGAESVTYNSPNKTFTLNYNAGVSTANSMKTVFDDTLDANPGWPQWTCVVEGTGAGLWVTGDDGKNAASGPDPLRYLLTGVHEITAVDSANNTITLCVKQRSSYLPGLMTSGSGYRLKTILTCNTDAVLEILSDRKITLQDLCLSAVGMYSGLVVQPRAELTCADVVAFVNGDTGLQAQVESLIIGSIGISGCNVSFVGQFARLKVSRGIFTGSSGGSLLTGCSGYITEARFVGNQNQGERAEQSVISQSSAVFIGNVNDGLQAYLGSSINMSLSEIYYQGGNGVRASSNSLVNIQSSTFKNNGTDTNPAGPYPAISSSHGVIVTGY